MQQFTQNKQHHLTLATILVILPYCWVDNDIISMCQGVDLPIYQYYTTLGTVVVPDLTSQYNLYLQKFTRIAQKKL